PGQDGSPKPKKSSKKRRTKEKPKNPPKRRRTGGKTYDSDIVYDNEGEDLQKTWSEESEEDEIEFNPPTGRATSKTVKSTKPNYAEPSSESVVDNSQSSGDDDSQESHDELDHRTSAIPETQTKIVVLHVPEDKLRQLTIPVNKPRVGARKTRATSEV